LNAATGGLEGWPIPNIQQITYRIGIIDFTVGYHQTPLHPKVFGIIDFTVGYHQTPLHPDPYSHLFTGKVLQWKLYLQDKDFDLFQWTLQTSRTLNLLA
jgi:hypothetical protein